MIKELRPTFYSSSAPASPDKTIVTLPRVRHGGIGEKWQQTMSQPESRKEVNKAPQISRLQSVPAGRDPRGQFVFLPKYIYVGNPQEGAINISHKKGEKKNILDPSPLLLP